MRRAQARKVRKTVFLDPQVARAVTAFAAMNGKSFSEVMAGLAVRKVREDQKHIRIIKRRKNERVRSYDGVARRLRRRDLL